MGALYPDWKGVEPLPRRTVAGPPTLTYRGAREGDTNLRVRW